MQQQPHQQQQQQQTQLSPTLGSSFRVPQIRRTTQACDACKLRKVKCNGQSRCQQCSHLNLRCVYSAPKPRQKSLKRGQLIAKYKQSTTNGNQGANSGDAMETSESPASTSTTTTTTTTTLPAITTLFPESPSSATASSPPQDTTFFSNYLHDYEVSVYPVNPIITVAEVQSYINEMHTNSEARAFVYAYMGVTINLTGYASLAESAHTAAQVEYWCGEAIRARGLPSMVIKASVRKIVTAQFLHVCLMGLRNQDAAFYYLREAVTMVQMLRIDHPDVMRSLSLFERARRQRMYCEAVVVALPSSSATTTASPPGVRPLTPTRDPRRLRPNNQTLRPHRRRIHKQLARQPHGQHNRNLHLGRRQTETNRRRTSRERRGNRPSNRHAADRPRDNQTMVAHSSLANGHVALPPQLRRIERVHVPPLPRAPVQTTPLPRHENVPPINRDSRLRHPAEIVRTHGHDCECSHYRPRCHSRGNYRQSR